MDFTQAGGIKTVLTSIPNAIITKTFAPQFLPILITLQLVCSRELARADAVASTMFLSCRGNTSRSLIPRTGDAAATLFGPPGMVPEVHRETIS